MSSEKKIRKFKRMTQNIIEEGLVTSYVCIMGEIGSADCSSH